MKPPRAPMEPPDLDGYEPVGLLGSGGFSDVFLYERAFPRMKVAIKVLVPGALGDDAEGRFTAEANVMAGLSTHPYIVTVYEAAVSPAGLPYIVMEYYPRPNHLVRARRERFTVDAVLRVGIQVASALETAHRRGVLHRDVKPPNILTSEYGRPGLTDFGLAAGDGRGAAEGLSIPWSPPEVVTGGGPVDERADVYSLAATLWTLLAGGRSPFEVDGANKGIDLIDRIERAPVRPVDRADVPASLQRLLAHALAKDPRGRPASAAELARALQVIEVEQRFDMTAFEVGDDQPGSGSDRFDDDGGGPTRVRNLPVIEPQPPPVEAGPAGDAMIEAPAALRPAPSPQAIVAQPLIEGAPVGADTGGDPVDRRGGSDGSGADGPHAGRPTTDAPGARRPETAPDATPPTSAPPAAGRSRRAVALAALVVVVAVVLSTLVGFVYLGDDDGPGASPTTTAPGTLAAPTNVRVERIDGDDWRALWDAPSGMRAGDHFALVIDGRSVEAPFNRTTFEFTSERSSPCVVVTAVHDGVASPPATNRGEC